MKEEEEKTMHMQESVQQCTTNMHNNVHNNMHNNRGTIQHVPKSKQSNALVTMMSRT